MSTCRRRASRFPKGLNRAAPGLPGQQGPFRWSLKQIKLNSFKELVSERPTPRAGAQAGPRAWAAAGATLVFAVRNALFFFSKKENERFACTRAPFCSELSEAAPRRKNQTKNDPNDLSLAAPWKLIFPFFEVFPRRPSHAAFFVKSSLLPCKSNDIQSL